jgi:hypothetical protein
MMSELKLQAGGERHAHEVIILSSTSDHLTLRPECRGSSGRGFYPT